jgi:hypothetical protein
MTTGIEDKSHEPIVTRLKATFSKSIPAGSAIAARAVVSSLGKHNTDIDWIKHNFSSLVESVQIAAYKEYLEAEARCGAHALVETFLPLVGENASPREVIDLIGRHFYALDRFFLGLTQGRRPRAGKVFEILIRELFVRLRYPFAAQPIINGQPDFVLPSLEHFRRHAPDCIIFTVKRTLRERWRQIVTEGTRGLGFYLATIDEDVGDRDLAEMLRSRITLVVPERVKKVRTSYEEAPNVISFESFFRFHLDPAMERWRAAGAVIGSI